MRGKRAQHGDGAASARPFPLAGRFAPSTSEEVAAPDVPRSERQPELTAGACLRCDGCSREVALGANRIRWAEVAEQVTSRRNARRPLGEVPAYCPPSLTTVSIMSTKRNEKWGTQS